MILRRVPWFFSVFVLATLIHLTWAVLLIFGEDPLGATPLHTLGAIVGNRVVLILILLGISAMALGSLLAKVPGKWGIMLMIPQTIAVVISGSGATRSVLSSSYADGVLRPAGFIGADQIGIILLTVLHTLALLWLAGVELRRG